jgi:hypothetical protein
VKPVGTLLILSAALSATAGVGACSGTSPAEGIGFPDAYLPIVGEDGGEIDGPNQGSPLSTSMRIANLTSRLGAIDLCVQTSGSIDFDGPLISPVASVEAGVPDARSPEDGGDLDAGDYDGQAFDASVEGSFADSGMTGLTDGALLDEGVFDVGQPEPSPDAGEPGPSAGLAPFQMSNYIELKSAGTFEFAIVLAGVGSCDHPIFKQLVTLDPGERTTVVLATSVAPTVAMGDGGGDREAPPILLSFTDESGPRPGQSRTRFINVASRGSETGADGAVTIGVLDSTANLSPLAAVIEPGFAASPSSRPPVVDALGYHEGDPMGDPLAFRIGPASSAGALSWTSAAVPLELRSGTVHTGFIVGQGPESYAVLWCDDLAKTSRLASCVFVGQ